MGQNKVLAHFKIEGCFIFHLGDIWVHLSDSWQFSALVPFMFTPKDALRKILAPNQNVDNRVESFDILFATIFPPSTIVGCRVRVGCVSVDVTM